MPPEGGLLGIRGTNFPRARGLSPDFMPNLRSVGERLSLTDSGESRVRRAREQRGPELLKWSKSPRLVRVVLILGAIAAFAAAAGAGTRWG